MSAYSRILVAVDFTDEAQDVVTTAREVAERNGAELHFLTVIKPIHYAYSGYDALAAASGFASFESQAQENAKERLTSFAQQCGQDQEHIAILIGSPAREIKDHAERLAAELIVVGAHCRHGLGVLLGSTANGVLHGAPCDVLTVQIE